MTRSLFDNILNIVGVQQLKDRVSTMSTVGMSRLNVRGTVKTQRKAIYAVLIATNWITLSLNEYSFAYWRMKPPSASQLKGVKKSKYFQFWSKYKSASLGKQRKYFQQQFWIEQIYYGHPKDTFTERGWKSTNSITIRSALVSMDVLCCFGISFLYHIIDRLQSSN